MGLRRTAVSTLFAVLFSGSGALSDWRDHCVVIHDESIEERKLWSIFVFQCLTGPDVSIPWGCYARHDYDCDSDVDLADVAEMYLLDRKPRCDGTNYHGENAARTVFRSIPTADDRSSQR